MDQKLALTKEFLEGTGLPTDDKSLNSYRYTWWVNPRLNGNHSLRLTEQGFNTLNDSKKLSFTKIDIPTTVKITNQLIIWLDKFITCPYYLNKRELFVSNEYIAVQIIMYNGDIYSFCKAKAL